MQGRIAYLMSRFPNLSETFILREMTELESQGWQVSLYPLIAQRQPILHGETHLWLGRMQTLSFASIDSLATNAAALTHSPRRLGTVWQRALWENRTDVNMLVRAVALLPKAAQMARRMQREGITHIHAHYATHPALAAWAIHRLTGIGYSVTVHAHDIFVRTAMLATKLREAKFVVAISQYNREYLARIIGEWIRGKTHVIHCGVRPEFYTPRTTLHQPGEIFEIVNIGSLQPYKGHSFLVRACAKLREQGVPFRCRIVGAGSERETLEQLIAELQLRDSVQLLGSQSQEEVARLLPTAHCYVQPSVITTSGKMEGIPVAIMEAMACNVPVVATSISGIPELVRHSETGWLVPPADVSALSQAIEHVFANPAAAFRLAHSGRDLVSKEFSLRENVAQLSDLFARTLNAGQLLESLSF